MQAFQLKDTTATKKVFSLRKRIRAVCGGTSASKTVSILIWLIDYAQSSKGKKIDIISESFPHLSLGAMDDFKRILQDRNYWKDERWHETNHVYTFETGSKIQFISMDRIGKAHGPRRDVLFINEANNLSYAIVDQLITRTREIVWLDWNPSEEFWFYTEMQNKRQDIDFLTLTYKDNEALDPVSVAEIESHKDNKGWWQVYGLGQLGEHENKIYKGWQIIDEIPETAKLIRYGIDFGYSNDPTAIVAIYYWNGVYIFHEIAYQKGLTNKQIADILLSQEKAPVVADSAEPKSIDEIYSYGVQIIPAQKGPGSVLQGIQFIQSQKCQLTSRSVNIIKEYRNYFWMTDRNGRVINEPEHAFSHSMDAIRYPMSLEKPNRKTPEELKAIVEARKTLKEFDAFKVDKVRSGSRYLRSRMHA